MFKQNPPKNNVNQIFLNPIKTILTKFKVPEAEWMVVMKHMGAMNPDASDDDTMDDEIIVVDDETDMILEKQKLFQWMEQWQQEGDDEQVVRSFLGRMLFSQNDIKKSVKVISGGEQGRMLFGKIMMHKPNILLMDEPTNHMDMESIEALNLALEAYEGTLMFVSHDRQFVSSVATRIWEVKDGKIIDFRGNYAEYLATKEA